MVKMSEISIKKQYSNKIEKNQQESEKKCSLVFKEQQLVVNAERSCIISQYQSFKKS